MPCKLPKSIFTLGFRQAREQGSTALDGAGICRVGLWRCPHQQASEVIDGAIVYRRCVKTGRRPTRLTGSLATTAFNGKQCWREERMRAFCRTVHSGHYATRFQRPGNGRSRTAKVLGAARHVFTSDLCGEG